MTPPRIESLTDHDLRRAFDTGTLNRGRPYAHAGMVRVRERSEDGLMVRGDVRGSGEASYSTTVQLRETRAGDPHVVASCTCPVGFSCKHAVALIVAVRKEIAPVDPLPFQVAPGRPAVEQAATPAWKTTLAPLVSTHQRAVVEWALHLEMIGSEQHGGRSLVARPMRRGARGGWVKSGATWNDVHYAAGSRSATAQSRALNDLHGAVTSTHYGFGRRSDGTIELSALTADAWSALDRLVESGVRLSGPLDSDVEIVPDPVEVGLAVRTDEHGDLRVSATIADEFLVEQRRESRLTLMGRPVHGAVAWDREPTLVRFVRFAHAVDDAVQNLLVTGRSVLVPQGDAEEFLRDYYPRIHRAVGVIEVDPRLEVPEVAPPRMSATIHHQGLEAELRWGFVYGEGDDLRRTPLGRGPEQFRDPAAEHDVLSAFVPPEVGLELVRVDSGGRTRLIPSLLLDGYDAVVLSEVLVPALEDLGVDVEIVGERPDYRLATADPVVHVSVDDDGRSDWYDLSVTVTIDGQDVPFEPLFAALAAGETHLVLPGGTYLEIDRPELVRLRELIDEARQLTDRRRTGMRVNRYHAGLWEELVTLGVVDRQSARWQQSVGALASIDAVERPAVPEGLAAELRPYQEDGFAWLSFLADHGLGGILADDMGLGKTVQALAMIVRQVERGTGPFLVVAPTSVVSNWVRETERFAPGLRIATITGTRARRGSDLADAVEGADVVVTSYALFRLEFEAYAERAWAGLLLDEAQFVKNRQGKTYQCARRLDVPFKLAMTGTPLENSLMDLWSMLSIVAPGLYPDPARFVEHYQKPIERGEGSERLALLQRRVRPLMRRRTKDEVASDLPPKTEQVLEVALNPKHERIYQTHLQRERQKILGLLADDEDGHRFEVLRSLTLLRQLSLDPALIDEEHADVGSAKIDLLMEHLQEVTAEGHKVLVFSQFTRYLQRVRERLDDIGIPHAYLDGRTRRRGEVISSFTDGDVPVFLISLKAGGFGLNLTQADYCYVLDPWWNPATEAQAVDRAHRIGQQRPVMVYRLVSSDTIEQKVMELKSRKAALFDAVMDEGAELSAALGADDIRGLLG